MPNELRLECHSKLNNAPVLDGIGWYSGNSSVNFELDNGIDISAFKDKQYDGNRSGTHPVGMKKPNAWGIHDMIGNVNEWCQDWFVKDYYSSGAELQDPKGPELGVQHVNKGGSFLGVPLFCCSSYRHTSPRRNWGDGFRLVLVESRD